MRQQCYWQESDRDDWFKIGWDDKRVDSFSGSAFCFFPFSSSCSRWHLRLNSSLCFCCRTTPALSLRKAKYLSPCTQNHHNSSRNGKRKRIDRASTNKWKNKQIVRGAVVVVALSTTTLTKNQRAGSRSSNNQTKNMNVSATRSDKDHAKMQRESKKREIMKKWEGKVKERATRKRGKQ